MAISDIRRFNFFQKYLWSPDDFEDMETWTYGAMEGLMEGLAGGAVLKGLRATSPSGLVVNVATGIACTPQGRIIVADAAEQLTLQAPTGNSKKVLVVLRPSLTPQTPIPQPTNPVVMVDLHEQYTYDLMALDGSEAASPSYPAVASGDVVVAGVTLSVGQTTLPASGFDLGAVDRPRRRKSRVRIVTGDYTMDGTEDVVEMDLSSASGTVIVPPASGLEGEHITFVRVDSSANVGQVSGYEPFSGQTVVNLDYQWQTMKVYSNGIAWRIV